MLSYMFDTNILRTIYGFEQRAALLGWPRKTVKYNVAFMSQADYAYFMRTMRNYQGQVFGVPIWGQQGVLTAQAPASQFYVDLTGVDQMDFEVGANCVVYADRDTYDIREISSMTSTRLNFSVGLSNTWPIGSTVYPMIHGTVEQNIPLQKRTSAYGGASLVFKEAWDDDITHGLGSHTFPEYQGYSVLDTEPNWAGNVRLSIARASEYLRNFGVQIRYTREQESELQLDLGYLWAGIDECAEIRGFFHDCRGKWRQFWCPSWQRDIEITGAIAPADDFLTIEDIDYSASWAISHIIGKYLFLMLPDGTKLYRKVIGWPSATQLNLSSAVGHTVPASQAHLTLASFLLPSRFEVDEMEMTYHRPHVVTTRVRMQSLMDENMTTTTT